MSKIKETKEQIRFKYSEPSSRGSNHFERVVCGDIPQSGGCRVDEESWNSASISEAESLN